MYCFPQTPVLWLDGSDPENDGTPPSDGSAITIWSDKSGNGYDATGGTGATFNSSGLNSKGTVTFNGAEHLISSFNWETAFNVGDPYVAFTVFVPTSLANNPVIWASIEGGPDHYASGRNTGEFWNRYYGGNGAGAGSGLSVGSGALGINGYNSTVGGLFTNLDCSAGSAPPAGLYNRGTETVIGSGHNSVNPYQHLNGEIAEIRIYAGSLTTTEITAIEDELKAKWGLCSGPPAEALDFDGTDDYVDLANNSIIGTLTNFSIEVWVNATLLSRRPECYLW